MEASVVGIRLASGALTPLIKKLFQSEGPGAGLAGPPASGPSPRRRRRAWRPPRP
ncbi:hypothetical protein ACIPUC_36000 [Streptomyces sp. LARHCF249]